MARSFSRGSAESHRTGTGRGQDGDAGLRRVLTSAWALAVPTAWAWCCHGATASTSCWGTRLWKKVGQRTVPAGGSERLPGPGPESGQTVDAACPCGGACEARVPRASVVETGRPRGQRLGAVRTTRLRAGLRVTCRNALPPAPPSRAPLQQSPLSVPTALHAPPLSLSLHGFSPLRLHVPCGPGALG